MSIQMPQPDMAVIARRRGIVKDLRAIIHDPERVVDDENERTTYDSDAMASYNTLPMVVVLPNTTDEVAGVLRYCYEQNIKIVPRGAGTSLSGGSHPIADAVLLVMSKFNRILDIDYDNRCAVVQPGVANLNITKAVEDMGFYYAPDPSSQLACSIGGNIAENSGGVHCLKYGMTTNNILGLEVVTIEGDILRLGGKFMDSAGYDLLGLMIGSEGLLAVVTEVTVRILTKPETSRAMLVGFDTAEDAGLAVAGIIAAGFIPAAIEMMDRPSIIACEAFANAGYPLVEALLLIELDGPNAEVDELIKRTTEVCTKFGANYFKTSNSEEEKARIWLGRKSAFPACARLAPDYIVMDGSIPRKKLGFVLNEIEK